MRYNIKLPLERNLNDCLYYGLQKNDEDKENTADTAVILFRFFLKKCKRFPISTKAVYTAHCFLVLALNLNYRR